MSLSPSHDAGNEAKPSGDVFISHHSAQYGAAKAAKAALAVAGLRGWLAPDDVDPGSAFDTQIVAQIKRSDAVVLLLDGEADRSRHVKRELMLADDEGLAVFPVRLEPIRAEGLAYFLKDKQWIDWFEGKGDGLDRVVEAVRGHCALPPVERPSRPTKSAAKRRWPLIAGGAAALALAAGLGGLLLIPRLSGPAPVVKPGLWLNKREMTGVTFPEVTAVAARQIKETVENDPNPEECITDSVARAPDVKLFDPGNKGHCSLTSFQVGNGRMSGYLACPMPSVKGGVMTAVFTANYTPTTIVVDQEISMAQPGGMLKFKARDSSHWVAADCPTERR